MAMAVICAETYCNLRLPDDKFIFEMDFVINTQRPVRCHNSLGGESNTKSEDIKHVRNFFILVASLMVFRP